MKLKFDSHQDYQLEAVHSVLGLFEEQDKDSGSMSTQRSIVWVSQAGQMAIGSDLIVSNQLSIDQTQILKNLKAVQSRYNEKHEQEADENGEKYGGIQVSDDLSVMNYKNTSGIGDKLKEFQFNFSIEMETGTGKTYTYLRTIHELYRKYGFSKFVIVVPSVAIREGTIKNLEVTQEHFDALYDKPEMEYRVWNSKQASSITKQFGTNDSLQILVINIDSFVGDSTVIRQDSDHGVPLEYIQATNPIVIVDEPQNMETDKRKSGIMDLNPLCTLRYSATHKNPYNLLYKLDPVRAYDLWLVKKIEVDSVYSEDVYADAYVKILKVGRSGKWWATWAQIEIDKSDEQWLQKLETKVSEGDDLYELTGREVYDGYIVDFIDDVNGEVFFTNAKSYKTGEDNSLLKEQTLRYQIERTVEDHFEKERKLKWTGIKVLSLFFIDAVHNYREYADAWAGHGKFAVWFEEAYKKVQAKPQNRWVLDYEASEVHDGYFSQDKSGAWKDSKDTKNEWWKTKDDVDTYNLIMKDKERLLSTKEPLRFIFSHSALREGWDNPNVFQICTLNESHSEIKKRQEIGRGLRLAVNDDGERIFDPTVNILTVIANESYKDFADSLQKEIEDETGVHFGWRIKEKAKRKPVTLKKEYKLDENFNKLWDRIKQKTRYSVDYSVADLIKKSASLLSTVPIPRPTMRSERHTILMDRKLGIRTQYRTGARLNLEEQEVAIVPDVIHRLQLRTSLNKAQIVDILKASGQLKKLLQNPEKLIDAFCDCVRQAKQQLMVDGIRYEQVAGSQWEMTRFEDDELEEYIDRLVEVQNQDKSLYDYIITDSIVEQDFAHELDSDERIQFYFKLPRWFHIDTPLGKYNPDWAIVFEEDKRVYFIAETKSTDKLGELRPSEKAKIECGEKHFEQLDEVFLHYGRDLNQFIDRIEHKPLTP